MAIRAVPGAFGVNQYALLVKPSNLPAVMLDWMQRLVMAALVAVDGDGQVDRPSSRPRRLLGAIRQLLGNDKNVIKGARVRFLRLNASLLGIAVFAYIRTHDFAIYLGMCEELFLNTMGAIAA